MKLPGCRWSGDVLSGSRRVGLVTAAVDELLALGTDTDHGDGQTQLALEELDQDARVHGQVLVRAAAGDVLVPPGELLVDRSASHRSGELLQLRACLVAHAHLDGGQAGHDIQLGQRQVGGAVHLDVVLETDEVEPGAVAGATGGGTELATDGLHVPASELVVLGLDVVRLHRLLALGGEAGGHDVVANTSQVRLEHRPHVAEVLGAEAGTREDSTDRGDRAGAVLTVTLLEAEAGALTTFGDDVPSSCELLTQPGGTVDQQRTEEGAEADQASDHLVHHVAVCPLATIELGELVAHAVPDLLDFGAQHRIVEDVVHPDAGAPLGFGGSRGADAALGRADLVLASGVLTSVVESDVERSDHCGLGVEPQTTAGVQALLLEELHLLLEDVRVYQHATGDEVVDTGTSDTTGHQVQLDRDDPTIRELELDGVTAVVGTLEAEDGLRGLCQVVRESRLGLVTELSTENHADDAAHDAGDEMGSSRHGILHYCQGMQCYYEHN